jgi:hypothetical protein
MRYVLHRLFCCLLCASTVWAPALISQSSSELPSAPQPVLALSAQISGGYKLETPPPPECNQYSMQTMPLKSPSDRSYGGFSGKQRLCFWRDQLFSGSALFGAAFFGAIAQAQDDPHEWPQGADGFGRRMGTRYTQGVIKSTGTFLVSALVGEDPRTKPPQIYYVPAGADISPDTGDALFRAHNSFGCRQSITVKGRIGQSLLRMVWDSCRKEVIRRPRPGRLAGSFASGFSSLAWAPSSKDTIPDALSASGSAFGGYVAESVLSEFAPDLERLLGKLIPSRQYVPVKARRGTTR